MLGDGIDWIESILINDDGTFIYATTTGNCVKASIKGKAEFKANLGIRINKVVVASGLLHAICRSPMSVVVNIIENHKVLECPGEVIISDQFLVALNDKTISIFGIDGSIGPTIECLQPVRFIALTRAGLIIDSGPSQYIFEVTRE